MESIQSVSSIEKLKRVDQWPSLTRSQGSTSTGKCNYQAHVGLLSTTTYSHRVQRSLTAIKWTEVLRASIEALPVRTCKRERNIPMRLQPADITATTRASGQMRDRVLDDNRCTTAISLVIRLVGPMLHSKSDDFQTTADWHEQCFHYHSIHARWVISRTNRETRTSFRPCIFSIYQGVLIWFRWSSTASSSFISHDYAQSTVTRPRLPFTTSHYIRSSKLHLDKDTTGPNPVQGLQRHLSTLATA